MISANRLIEMARKWQKMAVGNRKRISYPPRNHNNIVHMHYSSTANKGHFVVYSVDHKRFEVPLKYLSTNVFRELLNWSEEEFGLPSNGPITLPCDSVFLDYVISLIRERVPEEVEKALITSMVACHHEASSSSSRGLRQSNEPMIIYGFWSDDFELVCIQYILLIQIIKFVEPLLLVLDASEPVL